MCDKTFKIYPTTTTAGIPSGSVYGPGNEGMIKPRMVGMKCFDCNVKIGRCCMCKSLLPLPTLRGSPTDEAPLSFENDGNNKDAGDGNSNRSLSLVPSQSSSSKSVPIIPNKSNSNSEKNNRYQYDAAYFEEMGYGVVCSTCNFPNLLSTAVEWIESFEVQGVRLVLDVEFTLDEFIVACVCNNQPLDFGAKAQQLLGVVEEDVDARKKEGQVHVKKKRLRRRNKTFSSKNVYNGFQSLGVSCKEEILLLKELEKRVKRGIHIQSMALHLYHDGDEVFTPYDLCLLEVAFEKDEIILSQSTILTIAAATASRQSYSQTLKTRALKELCNLEYGLQADTMMARSNLRLEYENAASKSNQDLESVRSGLNLIGQEVSSLICVLCEMGKSSWTRGDHYRDSAKIIRDKIKWLGETQSHHGQAARSLHILHLLIKLFSTMIMI